jgi:hypothetical protein
MSPILAQIAVLAGSTLAIWAIDRGVRRSRSATAVEEPAPETIVALCFALNAACLPYYFYKSRGSVGGLFLGLGAFVACVVLSGLAGVAVRAFA